MASAAGFSADAIFNSWLWHAQAVHIFVSVGESWHSGAATAAAATSGRVAVKRPEPGSRQAVGFHERVNGVNVVQAGDLVLGISLADHHGDANVVKGDAGLRMERLSGCDRGLPHIAGVIHHHTVVGVS